MGSAQLLMSQKFQQFYWLCQQNMVSGPQVAPPPNGRHMSIYTHSWSVPHQPKHLCAGDTA